MFFDRTTMSLYRRILLSLAIPALFLSIIGVSGYFSVRVLARAADRILSDNYQSIQAARRMERALISMNPCFLSAGDCGRFLADSLAFEEALGICEGNITEPGESALLEEIRREWEGLKSRMSTADQALGQRPDTAPLELHDRIGRLIEINERAMFDIERDTRRTARMMTLVVVLTSLIAVGALFAFAFVSARRISRPILDVADDLHRALAAGDSVRDDENQPRDEITRLRTEMEELLVRLARYEGEQSRRFLELQESFILVSNQVREGLLVLGDKTRVQYINLQGKKILGIEQTEISGQLLGALKINPEVVGILKPVLSGEAVTETDLSEVTLEVDGVRRTYRPRFLSGLPERMPEVSLVIFWDITEQRRFEEARRSFIAMLSHQLKTPITSLTMSVNLLRERLTDVSEETIELLEHAGNGCAGLSLLVSELIDAARETTPEMTLRKTRVNLVPLLRNAVKPLSPQAADKGISIVDEMGSEPAWASVDPIKFSWVITNAVGNALRYTPRGGSITVRLRRNPEGIEIRIIDTGVGIEPDRLKEIFKPSDPSELRDPGSHGLGLSIAKEIIDAHRGSISIASTKGVGTTVYVTIPIPGGETDEPNSDSR